MDNTTKSFAQKIVSELEKMGTQLGLIHSSVSHTDQPRDRPQGNANEPKDREKIPRPEFPCTESRIPTAIVQMYDPHSIKNERRQQWNFGIAIFTAAVIAIYTTVAALQLSTMLDTFHNDQRAWIGVLKVHEAVLTDSPYSSPPGINVHPVYLKEGSRIQLGVLVTNFGKGPALNTRTLISHKILRREVAFRADYGGVNPQGSVVTFPQMQTSLFTNGNMVDKRTVVAIETGIHVLYLFGRITYDDVFKKHHETTFCMELSNTREVFQSSEGSCGSYNTAN